MVELKKREPHAIIKVWSFAYQGHEITGDRLGHYKANCKVCNHEMKWTDDSDTWQPWSNDMNDLFCSGNCFDKDKKET